MSDAEVRELIPASASAPTPAQSNAVSIYGMLERMIRDPDIDPLRIQQFMELQERAEKREAEKAFAKALQLAQSDMKPVWRNKENPQTHSRYADLEAVDDVIRPIYVRHGFALSFDSRSPAKDQVTVICTVFHEAGYSKTYELTGGLDTTGAKGMQNKTEMHGLGSSASYLRRYLQAMIFNLTFTNEDNDGNLSGGALRQWQIDNIQDLLHEMQLSPERTQKFLETMGAKTVPEINVGAYPAALNLLQAMRKRAQ